MTDRTFGRSRALLPVSLGGSLLLILVATLTADASHRGSHWLRDHEWGPIALGVSAARAFGVERSDVEVLAHLLIFALFGALILAALRSGLPPSRRPRLPRAIVTGLMLAAVLGAATEFAQLLVAGRSASFVDWTVDIVGAVFGMLLLGPLTWSVQTLRSPTEPR